jgi:hypothetical protein
MFALADLIVLNAIEAGLENLRQNPHHLDFILGKYEDTPYMRQRHGQSYVRQCREFITKNKITVKPYYVLDSAKLPSISVVAQYQEEIQVLGDYGSVGQPTTLPPVVLGEVSGVAWSDEPNELIIGNANEVVEWIYSGAYLEQGDFISRIDLVIPDLENDRARIVCADSIPKVSLAGWAVTTSPSHRIAILNASGNMATVSIDLKSSGDIETHKLLALVVRYCLKKGRLLMDSEGLQVSTSSQNFPMAYDEEQGIFQTVFTLTGKIWDCWIQDESDTGEVGLTFCAVPSKVTSRDQIVHF